MLLGARQTGKSTLLSSLNPELTLNFADEEVYLRFASDNSALRSQLSSVHNNKLSSVFIDEIQRLPNILNTIQAIIDEKKSIKFLLSGSSARKLKRGQANLLPGRIHSYQLGAIVPSEYDYNLDTKKILSTGTLPGILTEVSKQEAEKTLRSYAAIYLKEEIQAESLSRNIEGFARFLKVVASWSGTLVDYVKVSSLASISRQSVARYFDILEDTLIFHRVGPFSKSSRLRLIQHPKFCIFDVGVLNGLLNNFQVSDDRIGALFETLVISQLYASLYARDKEGRISYFLTESGAEVDIILEMDNEVFCIEVKSASSINNISTNGFDSFKKFYKKPCKCFVFYMGEVSKKIKDIEIVPWQVGFKLIGL